MARSSRVNIGGGGKSAAVAEVEEVGMREWWREEEEKIGEARSW